MAISTHTNQELLDATRDAIFTITSGKHKEYTINGRTFTKLDLKDLRDQAAALELAVASETAPRRPSVGAFGNPSGGEGHSRCR